MRWVEVIRAMAAEGMTDIVECGPGKVLAGLTRRIEPGLASHAIADPASLAADAGGALVTTFDGQSRWSPALRAASDTPSASRSRVRARRVIGTATREEGADRFAASLAAEGCPAPAWC